jgi:hypothetical protein
MLDYDSGRRALHSGRVPTWWEKRLGGWYQTASVKLDEIFESVADVAVFDI